MADVPSIKEQVRAAHFIHMQARIRTLETVLNAVWDDLETSVGESRTPDRGIVDLSPETVEQIRAVINP